MNLRVRVDGPCFVLGLLGADTQDFADTADHEPEAGRRSEAVQPQILLVEDDRAIREVLQGVLEDAGYAVTTAENGRQALERLRTTGRPDLIILDLRLPIMDGWQFRAAQKADPALAGIPVLAISADGSAKAAAIDAAAYIRKPLSSDAVLGAISRILVDVERRRLSGKLEEIERRAVLGRLAASVGHEINNPLAFASINLDLVAGQVKRYMADDSGSPEDLSALPVMLSACRGGLDRIRDVVKDLQWLCSKSQPARETLALESLLDESLAMAGNHVRHRATVRKEYGDVPDVVGDRSAIGQVLLNLILNAAQALPEARADANVIYLKTYADDETVTIEVGDTGAGISPQVLPHIFDPFYTTKSIGEGTGLGLAVSSRIVADHGGRIEVKSEVGRGSSFRVVLPVAGAVFNETAANDLELESKPARGRILVIDDVPDIGLSIAAALPEHDVTCVSKASEAFARLASNEMFDVILCDVLMPDAGGRGVVERLKAEWPHLLDSVILMTGGTFTPESREFLQRSPYKVLVKPFSIDELSEAILVQLHDRPPRHGLN